MNLFYQANGLWCGTETKLLVLVAATLREWARHYTRESVNLHKGAIHPWACVCVYLSGVIFVRIQTSFNTHIV